MINSNKAHATDKPLAPDLLEKMNAYWRAANYLSVGQIYLYDNPLLRQPLQMEQIKPRLLGHWGTTPGLNFIYVHLNRVIRQHDLDMIYVTGPGHGGPGLVANTYLEGTYSEFYPPVSQDEQGMKQLFTQFSFPGGIPSHVAAETPGSINEGGELGYSLSHSFGAAFDNPDLIVACVVGDGEAETGPLATSWHSNKFLNPVHDGAVLPILHLNGYEISGPVTIASDGSIIACTVHGSVCAFAPLGYFKYPAFNAAGEVFNHPAAIGADGRIYVVAQSGNVFCLTKKLTLSWSYYLGAPGNDGTIALGTNGMVYIGGPGKISGII